MNLSDTMRSALFTIYVNTALKEEGANIIRQRHKENTYWALKTRGLVESYNITPKGIAVLHNVMPGFEEKAEKLIKPKLYVRDVGIWMCDAGEIFTKAIKDKWQELGWNDERLEVTISNDATWRIWTDRNSPFGDLTNNRIDIDISKAREHGGLEFVLKVASDVLDIMSALDDMPGRPDPDDYK